MQFNWLHRLECSFSHSFSQFTHFFLLVALSLFSHTFFFCARAVLFASSPRSPLSRPPPSSIAWNQQASKLFANISARWARSCVRNTETFRSIAEIEHDPFVVCAIIVYRHRNFVAAAADLLFVLQKCWKHSASTFCSFSSRTRRVLRVLSRENSSSTQRDSTIRASVFCSTVSGHLCSTRSARRAIAGRRAAFCRKNSILLFRVM